MKKVTKTFISEIKNVDKKNLVIEHFISTETPDRIGDVVRVDGMKLRGAPSVLIGHNHAGEPIAKPLELSKGKNKAGAKGIIAKTQYYPDETGERLFNKAVGGFMPNWSIGFESIEDTPIEGGGTEFKEWELLEYSQVAVPMNPEATGKDKMEYPLMNEGGITFKWDERGTGLEMPSIKEDDGIETILEDTEKTILFFPKDMIDKEIMVVELAAEKPFENEHACRLKDPGDFDKFARKNCEILHDDKCIDVIYGIKGDKSKIQALRYPKDIWKEKDAKAHCKDKGGTFEAAAKEDKSIADRTRTNLAYSSLDTLYYGFLYELDECGGEEKTVKKIVKEFADLALPFALEFSQSIAEARRGDAQLKFYYYNQVKGMELKTELEGDNIYTLKDRLKDIEGLELKEGKVLSKKNWNMLKGCHENLGKVLESAGQAADDDKGIINNPKLPEKKDTVIRLIDDSTPADTAEPTIALTEETLASIKDLFAEQGRQMQEGIDGLLGKVK